MGLKQIDGLPGNPDQGYLKFLHDRSVIVGSLTWTDISHHPGKAWIKIWYAEDLTTEQETEIEALVLQSQIEGKFHLQTGEEFYEHQSTNNSRWNRRASRVKFGTGFNSEPNLEITNAEFDGLANMQVVAVTGKGFNFSIEANSGRGVPGITAIAFEWKAWTI